MEDRQARQVEETGGDAVLGLSLQGVGGAAGAREKQSSAVSGSTQTI